MRYATSGDIEQKLSAFLDSVQDEPMLIERDNQKVAVLVSARDYDRLSGKAAHELNEFCDAVADRAAARGLTEDKLEELLRHA